MPIENFNFDTFTNSGSGASWANPGNAETSNDSRAEADLSGSESESKLLVCTGADLSSLPSGALVIRVKLNIEAKYTSLGGAGAEIHEIYAWDGTTTQGRNQAGDFLKSSLNGPITLTTSDAVSGRGTGGWLWWRPDRLINSSNGVAIRAKVTSGAPKVQIDHVELEVEYIVISNSYRLVDPRVIAFERVAGGTGSDVDRNEYNEPYQPQTFNGKSWHTHPEDALIQLIANRTAVGIKRIVFGTPAGKHLQEQLVSSHQWEPMFDDQRHALLTVIPDWLKSDPEREAILYLGTKIANPARISMSGAADPDVNDADDVKKLERTLFPYRDLVGIKRFMFDNSSASAGDNKQRMLDFFEWGRNNGMEFLMEAIPHTGSDVDDDFVEVYGAYALTRFINGSSHDPDRLWDFSKGRLGVQIRSGDHSDITGDEWFEFMADFAREGYVLIPRDKNASLDPYAMEVAGAFMPRRASHSAASSAVRSAMNSAEHQFDDQSSLSFSPHVSCYL